MSLILLQQDAAANKAQNGAQGHQDVLAKQEGRWTLAASERTAANGALQLETEAAASGEENNASRAAGPDTVVSEPSGSDEDDDVDENVDEDGDEKPEMAAGVPSDGGGAGLPEAGSSCDHVEADANSNSSGSGDDGDDMGDQNSASPQNQQQQPKRPLWERPTGAQKASFQTLAPGGQLVDDQLSEQGESARQQLTASTKLAERLSWRTTQAVEAAASLQLAAQEARQHQSRLKKEISAAKFATRRLAAAQAAARGAINGDDADSRSGSGGGSYSDWRPAADSAAAANSAIFSVGHDSSSQDPGRGSGSPDNTDPAATGAEDDSWSGSDSDGEGSGADTADLATTVHQSQESLRHLEDVLQVGSVALLPVPSPHNAVLHLDPNGY